MQPSPYDGIIFDMDGTLTVPTLDFRAMRCEIGLPPRGDIAALIDRLPTVQRQRAWAIVERHEEEACRQQRLQPGCADLLCRCRGAGLRLGVVTRNTRRSVDALCQTFGLNFDAVLTREFPHMKPSPEPVLHILRLWNLPAARVLMVGDYVHDIESGRAAGVPTCLYLSPGRRCDGAVPDLVAESMEELAQFVFP